MSDKSYDTIFEIFENHLLFEKSFENIRGVYNIAYLKDVCSTIGQFLELGEKITGDNVGVLVDKFLNSNYCLILENKQLSKFCYYDGMDILKGIYNIEFEINACDINYNNMYWAGYSLAILHWYSGVTLRELIDKYSLRILLKFDDSFCKKYGVNTLIGILDDNLIRR